MNNHNIMLCPIFKHQNYPNKNLLNGSANRMAKAVSQNNAVSFGETELVQTCSFSASFPTGVHCPQTAISNCIVPTQYDCEDEFEPEDEETEPLDGDW